MKKLFFLGACLVALASWPVKAQTGGADVVTVVAHLFNGRGTIAISHGPGKTETHEFEYPINQRKSTAPIAEVYQQTVATLTQQGYALAGMSGGNDYTTLVFVKKQ